MFLFAKKKTCLTAELRLTIVAQSLVRGFKLRDKNLHTPFLTPTQKRHTQPQMMDGFTTYKFFLSENCKHSLHRRLWLGSGTTKCTVCKQVRYVRKGLQVCTTFLNLVDSKAAFSNTPAVAEPVPVRKVRIDHRGRHLIDQEMHRCMQDQEASASNGKFYWSINKPENIYHANLFRVKNINNYYLFI